MEKSEYGMAIVGLILFITGIWVLVYEPTWVESAGAGSALIAAGVTLLLITTVRVKRKKRGEIIEDEREVSIGLKAAYRAFQVSFILMGLLMAIFGITELSAPVESVIGPLFAVTALTYLVYAYYYRREM
ncbi:MAG: DUF2178 domain-containing protein [Archaeoglobaceae archaeon]